MRDALIGITIFIFVTTISLWPFFERVKQGQQQLEDCRKLAYSEWILIEASFLSIDIYPEGFDGQYWEDEIARYMNKCDITIEGEVKYDLKKLKYPSSLYEELREEI